jgi:hypothetical protein
MKKLLRTEMKNVMGGYFAPPVDPGGGGITCPTACTKWNNGTQRVESGTCSIVSTTVGGVTLQGCECSLTGGNGCSS